MSDGLSQTGGTPRILQQAQTRGEQVVRLITLPQALQDNARGQRLEGEVLKQNNDGTIRISTPQGDVDVEVKGRQPQPGQRLEVDVPAGRPPRQAVIRQSSQQQQPSQNEEQPVQSQIARTQSRADITARNVQSDQTRELIETAQRPIQSQSASSQQTATAKTRPTTITQQPLPQHVTAQPQNTAAPLPQGTTVRLTPVSPAQVQQFITQFTQSAQITQAVVQNAAFQATLSVQNVLSQNTQTLLTTVTSVQSAQPAQTQPIQQNPVQTLLSSLLKPLPQSSGQQAGGSVPPSQSPLFERLAQTAPQFLTANAEPELQTTLRPTIQILPASAAPLPVSFY